MSDPHQLRFGALEAVASVISGRSRIDRRAVNRTHHGETAAHLEPLQVRCPPCGS